MFNTTQPVLLMMDEESHYNPGAPRQLQKTAAMLSDNLIACVCLCDFLSTFALSVCVALRNSH